MALDLSELTSGEICNLESIQLHHTYNNVKVAEKLRIHAALLPLCLEIISFSAFPPLHPHNVSSAKALTACRSIQAARVGRFAQQY